MQPNDKSEVRTAVISPNRFAYTETFIRTHVQHLPDALGSVVHLYGARTPIWKNDGKRLPPWYLHFAGSIIAKLAGKRTRRVKAFLANQLPAGLRESAMARSLRREAVDVVLAEYGTTGVAVMDAAAAVRLPLVVHFHGYDAFRYSLLEKYEAEYRRLFEAAQVLVVVSDDMATQLCGLGARPSKIVICPYGIDLEDFKPAHVRQSDPLLLAVGRFVDKKAPHLTLLAFARVLEHHGSARLVMAGEGPLMGTCQTLAQGLGIDSHVQFPGAISHENVRELMRKARAFVQHSVRAPSGDSEGNPVAIREAMASGLPVVATRHAGITTTVEHEITGFLVDEYDWRSMAHFMSELIGDPRLSAEMGKAGRQKAEHEFGVDRCIGKLASVMRGVV